jgi:RNA polymerase sigma-70 factor (ECF subfamily)
VGLGAKLVARLEGRAAVAGEDLDAIVAAHIAAGQARLPHRPVTEDAFVAHIASVLLEAEDSIDRAAVERLAAADLYLALALAHADETALAIAETELVPPMRQAAGKVDSNGAFVDEVVQRVREKLFTGVPPGVTSYRGSGPLARWVRVIASRIAVDLKRKDKRIDDDEDAVGELPSPDDPELAVIWQASAAEYKAALGQAFAALDRRARTLLRQRYLDDLDINALGKIYRVHPSTAFRWLEQIHEQLAENTRSLLRAKLALTESQIHSMERMVASQLQLSLPRMLRGGKR